jgi:cysteine-rich repeat protein
MKHTASTRLLLTCSLLFTACPSSDEPSGPEISPESTSEPADTDNDSPTSNPTTTGLLDLTTTSTTTSTVTSETTDTTGVSDTTDPTGASSESGDTSSGSTGFTPSETCGDGKIDPGEECDDAVLNSNTGACTLLCQQAECGDGLLWDGVEACDHGPDGNSDTTYNGCTHTCQIGDHCGDGVVQGPEECDLGEDNGSDRFPPESVACDMCHFDAKIVFLSSTTYKGGEIAVMNNGVEGAHAKCKLLAATAGFDNATNFKAWLSDAQHSPAKDFTKGDTPYVRPDGVRVADNWYDLTLNGPQEGIIITEAGQTILNAGVWTSTTPSGNLYNDNDEETPTETCMDWSSSSAIYDGWRGKSGVDKQQELAWMQWMNDRHWTSYTNSGCYVAYHIYCFEQ